MIITGDARNLSEIRDESVQCIITSPPYYGLRNYGMPDQIGLEKTPEEYIGQLVLAFREAWRCLKKSGVLWVNIGDSYAGSGKGPRSVSMLSKNWNPDYPEGIDPSKRHSSRWGGGNLPAGPNYKPKDLIGIPWMLAFALRSDGWYLRSEVIWYKTNPMPESANDRPSRAHETVFLLSKSRRYYFNMDAVRVPLADSTKNDPRLGAGLPLNRYDRDYPEDHGSRGGGMLATNQSGRNIWTVWTIPTKAYKGAHFSTFPEDLVIPCILSSTKPGDTILDQFAGSGTVGAVAQKLGRKFIMVDNNPKYSAMQEKRIEKTPVGIFNDPQFEGL